MALTVMITYDISEDARRARVAALLQTCGDRIQRSVFICAVTEDDVGDLLKRVAQTINPDTDAVHAFRQCRDCWDDVVVLGQAATVDQVLFWAVL